MADFFNKTQLQLTNLKAPLLVKYFIDGQNFHNRLRDFRLEIDQIDYHTFFKFILDRIATHIGSNSPVKEVNSDRPLKFLKAEWFSVSDIFIDYYPFTTMKKVHLQSHVQNKESGLWKKLMKYPTSHIRYPKRYQKIFNLEKEIDELVAEKAKENIRTTRKRLLALESKYKGYGALHDGKQLDLIKMKFSGFLKIKYEKRTWEEKGVDPAIACQMIASKLSTTEEQKYDDEHDIIPDYNSDVIVLISTDMDFVEAFKILYTLKVPCYMIHITNKISKNLNGNQPYCTHLMIKNEEMKQFVI